MKIVLLGYMASGKSTIGKRLSKKLNLDFLDLDDYIIEKENLSISDIFKAKGEIYFRIIEHKYLKEILNGKDNFILSLGGGTPCYANNMLEINKTNAISIYLQGSVSTLSNRLIEGKRNRPLVSFLNNEQIPEFVGKHIFERRFFYEQAKIKINIDNKDLHQILDELMMLLY